jgi:hypothetical protein
MAASADRHRRNYDDRGWMLTDCADVVALKSGMIIDLEGNSLTVGPQGRDETATPVRAWSGRH